MGKEINVVVSSYGANRALMLRYRDPATGKRRARSSGTRVRREAERKAAKLEAELRDGFCKGPSLKDFLVKLDSKLETILQYNSKLFNNGRSTMENGNLTLEIVEVTPEMAQAWLDDAESNQTNFRKLRTSTVAKYAGDMAAGRWHLNGAPLVFDVEEHLTDGQHRLRACVSAKTPFTTVVVRGVADTSALDGGLTRGFAQYLAHQGVASAGLSAGAAKLILAWEIGKLAMQSPIMSLNDLLDCHERHQSRLVCWVRHALRVREVCGASMPAAIVHIGCLHVKEDFSKTGREFLEGMGSGANLGKDDARLHLRTQLMADKVSKISDLPLLAKRAKVIIAWNRYAQGKLTNRQHLNYMPLRSEFPEVYQLPGFGGG